MGIKTYKVTTYDRTTESKHYSTTGGLTKEEVLELFGIDKADFAEAVETGYLGKDPCCEYEIEEE